MDSDKQRNGEHQNGRETRAQLEQRRVRDPEQAEQEWSEDMSGHDETVSGSNSSRAAAAEAYAANGQPKFPAMDPKTVAGTTATSFPEAECETITTVSMRVKSGGRSDRRALEQSCAGHKVELQEKAEWKTWPSQSFEQKLQRFELKCPGEVKFFFRRSQ